jgi:hypothetical protein
MMKNATINLWPAEAKVLSDVASGFPQGGSP